MSSSVNRSRAVNTSPADGNDVKPTSHLISPLPALSSLTPSILFLINLCFFFSLSCPFSTLHPTLSPDLSQHTFDSQSYPLTLPLAFLPFCPYVMSAAHSFSIAKYFNASSFGCFSEHFSFHYPPFSSFLRTSIHSSVWFKLQDYFLLFPLKGRWISFHEPGEQER